MDRYKEVALIPTESWDNEAFCAWIEERQYCTKCKMTRPVSEYAHEVGVAPMSFRAWMGNLKYQRTCPKPNFQKKMIDLKYPMIKFDLRFNMTKVEKETQA